MNEFLVLVIVVLGLLMLCALVVMKWCWYRELRRRDRQRAGVDQTARAEALKALVAADYRKRPERRP